MPVAEPLRPDGLPVTWLSKALTTTTPLEGTYGFPETETQLEAIQEVVQFSREAFSMKAKLTAFGEIEIEGERYNHDVVIEAGKVIKRAKKVSKIFRDQYGHTPLSLEEAIPWGGHQLIVGTGMYGSMPIMPEVHAEARRRGIEIVAQPTGEACNLLRSLKCNETYAILHTTC